MSFHQRLHARCGCSAAASAAGESAVGAGARPFPFASTGRVYERDRPFAVKHLSLDIELRVESQSVAGVATLDVARLDPLATEIVLDAIAFDLQEVMVDGRAITPEYDGREMRVPLGKDVQTARISVRYAATPRKGMYFLAPDAHVPQRPRQVWTQCQEEDGRYWFPCQDRPHIKMTTEMRVRAPRHWTVLSNGELLAKPASGEDEGGVWHWKMQEPHPSYLVTLVAGEFSELDEVAGSLPLSYLVPKGTEADARATFKNTAAMVELFGRLTGVAYPWNKYAQVVVHDFIFGGMENTTATTLYEHVLLDERARLDVTSDDLIAHELAHQWFGDLVTCRDWSEGWLNEGFATHLEHVWREHHLGRDEYDYGIKVDLDSYLSEAHGRYRRPIVCQDYDAPLDLFDRHLYEKGGLVLHLLRTELGTDVFWRGVSTYLQRHGKGIVETRDLLRALEEVSGRSLGRFFEQWLYKPGHPELDVTLSWEKDVLLVAVRQTHGATDGVPAHFDVPIDLDIRTPKGETRRERLMLRQKSETFALRCSERPLFVVVDPDMRILGEVAVKAPLDMLRSQLQKASTARGRWLAAMALGQSDDPMSLAVLEKALSDEEEFWGVRSECAEALGKIRSKEAFEVLARHARTSHPKVRRSVVGALGAFRTQAAVEALRPIALRDASYLVEAEAARALGKTRREGAFETLVDLLDRPSWADVLRAGVADGLAALRDERALPHLLARTRYGHSERARRAAIMALPKLTSDRRTRETIEELLEDTNAHVRLDAARALGDMGDARSRSALRVRIERELDPRVRRRMREVLRDLGADSRQSFKDLKDEFEKVTAEFSELKSRVGKLEARMDPKAAGGTVPTPAASSAEVASTARGTTGASSAAAKPTPRRRGVDKAIRHERETKVSRKPRRR